MAELLFGICIKYGCLCGFGGSGRQSERKQKKAILAALYFGVFQGAMPAVGYLGEADCLAGESLRHLGWRFYC